MISYLTLRLGVLKAKAQQQWKVDLVTNQHWYDDSKAGKRGGSRRGSSCQDKIRWQEQQLHSQLKSTIGVFILTVIYLFKIYLSSISAGYCAVVAVPVLDQWQRSIHKHGLPAAFGTSHTGFQTLPEWHSYRAHKQQHRKNNSTLLDVRHLCSLCFCKVTNTFFPSIFQDLNWVFSLIRIWWRKYKPNRLFPVPAADWVRRLYRFHPGSEKPIQCRRHEEDIFVYFCLFLWGCIHQWMSQITTVWRKCDWVTPFFARLSWKGSEVLLRF